MDIPIDLILPNPEQPRKDFSSQDLLELAASIRIHGVILPISVEQAGDHYILEDGERRLRAAKMAGLTVIPATIVPPRNGSGSRDRLERALIANIQRDDLNPIEEANAYARLRKEQSYTVEQVARRVGVSPSRVHSRLNLLKADLEIQALIASGSLYSDKNVVKALMEIPDKEARLILAQRAAQTKPGMRSLIAAAHRVRKALQRDSLLIPEHEAPAKAYALKSRMPDLPRWDALAQVGQAPPWHIVEQSASQVCDRCVLRSMASASTCGQCPLPESIKAMIALVNSSYIPTPSRAIYERSAITG